MPNEHLHATIERVRLAVPALAARPYLGAGCCVVAATDMVGDALDGLGGVRDVACDEERGEIRLELDADAGAGLLSTVRASLDGIVDPLVEVPA